MSYLIVSSPGKLRVCFTTIYIEIFCFLSVISFQLIEKHNTSQHNTHVCELSFGPWTVWSPLKSIIWRKS